MVDPVDPFENLWRICMRIRSDPAISNAGYTMKVNEADRMKLIIMHGIAPFYDAAVEIESLNFFVSERTLIVGGHAKGTSAV